jgi:hypothetical protein
MREEEIKINKENEQQEGDSERKRRRDLEF